MPKYARRGEGRAASLARCHGWRRCVRPRCRPLLLRPARAGDVVHQRTGGRPPLHEHACTCSFCARCTPTAALARRARAQVGLVDEPLRRRSAKSREEAATARASSCMRHEACPRPLGRSGLASGTDMAPLAASSISSTTSNVHVIDVGRAVETTHPNALVFCIATAAKWYATRAAMVAAGRHAPCSGADPLAALRAQVRYFDKSGFAGTPSVLELFRFVTDATMSDDGDDVARQMALLEVPRSPSRRPRERADAQPVSLARRRAPRLAVQRARRPTATTSKARTSSWRATRRRRGRCAAWSAA